MLFIYMLYMYVIYLCMLYMLYIYICMFKCRYDKAIEGAVVNIGLALSNHRIEPPPQGGWGGFLFVSGFMGAVGWLIWHQGRQGFRERTRFRVSDLG